MSLRAVQFALLIILAAPISLFAAESDRAAAAQALGKARPAVAPQPDGLIVCEAEEFQADAGGWKAGKWGENYYAATFANSFLSRKAFLGAPQQCEAATATMQVNVAEAGRYLALVRYEAAYRFETQFRVKIEQGGRVALDRLYGARDNVKVWAFSEKLKKEVGWSWGAVENIVWEGHDAFVDLTPGPATITLTAGPQPSPGAKRNVDLVMLTKDVDQVNMRIEKESYLPLDGMLTQSGDVWLRVTNQDSKPITFQGKGAPGGGNWQQHSPYWVHIRNWKAPSIAVEPGKASEWIEVGGTMDTLHDGQWDWTGDGNYKAEFGLKNAAGQIEIIATYAGTGDLLLAGDADTRYSRRLRKQEDVLYELLDYLKKENPAPHGRVPARTPIYAGTFTPLAPGRHTAAVDEFKRLFALTDNDGAAAGGRGYIDVRGVPTEQLNEYLDKLGPQKANIAVVSLGDEIGLPAPSGPAATDGFQQWLKTQGITLGSLGITNLPDNFAENIDPKLKESNPARYYWSQRFLYHYGIQGIKERTDILRRHLPNAGVGANYSPHYPTEHMFLGEVFKWVSVFRQDGMTLPWSEDYIWQVAVGSAQMNHINFDLFRAGLRHHPERKIMYYVMPHMPNNTPRMWQRLFYGALGHGMKMVNLFEFRPVQVSYTENHVDEPEMYRMVLRSFRELGLFEDIVQDGQVRGAEAALWFSETGDIWGDSHGSFAAAKRGLYCAIRHQQIPLDFVVEPDALDGTLANYKVLYLTDAHVSSAASLKIAEWVNNGGVLFGTAGAGMFDELNRPNKTLRDLFGIDQTSLTAPANKQITWIKQDLPFADPIDQVVLDGEGAGPLDLPHSAAVAAKFSFSPVIGVRSDVKLAGAKVVANFTPYTSFYHAAQTIPEGASKTLGAAGLLAPDEKKPAAVTRHQVGKGQAIYCAFLPSLSYYKPAVPLRPVDRGSTDDAMIHFLPTQYDPAMARLIAMPAAALARPVECSHPLVESMVIESKQGVAISLVNWTGKPIENLQVKVTIKTPANATLASGGALKTQTVDGGQVYTLNIDAADALILR